MYSKLDEKIEEETIVLFDLKNLPKNRFDNYFDLFFFNKHYSFSNNINIKNFIKKIDIFRNINGYK